MIKMKWIECIPRQWIEITTQSLEAWKLRDEVPPFLPENRRGYARVTPAALSKVGVPNTKLFVMDEYPLHGLGLYDLESWDQYLGYVWSTWTTKKAQPVHVDPALQAMIDQSLQMDSNAAGQTYHINGPSTSDTMVESKGSLMISTNDAPPFPVSPDDVSMGTPADKRSRESPDSTLKPEGKSLKTSGVASATTAVSGVASASAAVASTTNEDNKDALDPPSIRWKVAEVAETRRLMWQLHHRMPAWKSKAYIEALQARPIDLAALAEATGVQFASAELVEVAIKCLDEITKEMAKDTSNTSGADAVASSQSDAATGEGSADKKNPDSNPTATCATAQESESKDTDTAKQQQPDATASCDELEFKKECDSAKNPSENWITRLVNAGHDIMWPQGMTPSTGPTLLTGVKIGDADHLVDDLMEWERKFETANLDNRAQFLRIAQLIAGCDPMEAAAWESGYVPEAQGLPSDQLESRIQGSLPPLAKNGVKTKTANCSWWRSTASI